MCVSPLALSDRCATAVLFVDNLTGQNNSLLPDFKGLRINAANVPGVDLRITSVEVETSTLDELFRDTKASMLKVDVEGFEYEVLRGGAQWLARYKPIVMLEVQRHHSEVFGLLADLDYVSYSPKLVRLKSFPKSGTCNVFAVHSSRVSAHSLAAQ